jgi:hypothetical protein
LIEKLRFLCLESVGIVISFRDAQLAGIASIEGRFGGVTKGPVLSPCTNYTQVEQI